MTFIELFPEAPEKVRALLRSNQVDTVKIGVILLRAYMEPGEFSKRILMGYIRHDYHRIQYDYKEHMIESSEHDKRPATSIGEGLFLVLGVYDAFVMSSLCVTQF